MSERLLELVGVSKTYEADASLWARLVGKGGEVRAVSEVDLTVGRGETLGLVGESGCGKSTLARLILKLEDVTAGDVIFDGRNVTDLGPKHLDGFRSRVQIVFQDPQSSLNRSYRVETILASPLKLHRGLRRRSRIREAAADLLRLVGLDPAFLDRYPHELSGGQRQRVGIARALAVEPDLLVLDEPVSALDVSIQAQIVNLLHDLQTRLGLTYVFISHDLNVVRYLADRVAVMYFGRIVETGPVETIYRRPRHPYTRVLLSAVALPDPEHELPTEMALTGEVPSPLAPPGGCPFHPRCPLAQDRCRRERPELREIGGVLVACHLVES
ncbi:MAG: ABC transporter ATP-binding protein [Pseudomonadota bacterium]